MIGEKILVIGGIRSGKSKWAEKLIAQSTDIVYLATAQAWDTEMFERIENHKKRRPSSWLTIEEPLNITKIITELNTKPNPPAILLDCLSIWVTNLLLEKRNIDIELKNLMIAVENYKGKIIIVSNEVGLGGISSNALARAFTDVIGILHQQLTNICTRTYFVWCGLAIDMKKYGERV